ncbi:gamma-glutamylcyclotransferase family protein [Pandoraea pneumonica]|uniref:gamma-glutamylcyclotransferase family protein n=1 Tax=Pandoraea pneumonica TaxID=2508299 RepID=UPI003CEFA056
MHLELDDETFLYFAYGSNMYVPRLTAPTRAPSARALCAGYVVGRRLTFNKVSKDGSGKCDCLETGNPDDRIFGVLFAVNVGDRRNLDRVEGVRNGYEVQNVDVITSDRNIQALTYVATDTSKGVRPYDWYWEFVLRGAEEAGHPEDHVRLIRNTVWVKDPDDARAHRERAILQSSSGAHE